MTVVNGTTPTQVAVQGTILRTSDQRRHAAHVAVELPMLPRSALTLTENLVILVVTSVIGIPRIRTSVDGMIPKISLQTRCAVHVRVAVLTPLKEQLTAVETAATGTKTTLVGVAALILRHLWQVKCAVPAKVEAFRQ